MSCTSNLLGEVFGKLTVIKRDSTKNSHATWFVECECGNIFSVTSVNLKSKNTTRCKRCYHHSQRVLTKEDIKEMANLRSLGSSYQKIANRYCVSKSTVYRNIQKYLSGLE